VALLEQERNFLKNELEKIKEEGKRQGGEVGDLKAALKAEEDKAKNQREKRKKADKDLETLKKQKE